MTEKQLRNIIREVMGKGGYAGPENSAPTRSEKKYYVLVGETDYEGDSVLAVYEDPNTAHQVANDLNDKLKELADDNGHVSLDNGQWVHDGFGVKEARLNLGVDDIANPNFQYDI